MLTNKDIAFIEKVAKQLQNKIKIEKEPNIYNYSNLINFIKDMKYIIVFNSDKNYTTGNVIHLKCKEPNERYTDEDYINFQKDLLYEIWKIAKKKYMIPMFKFDENDAKYFFRAMLMPEEVFIKEVVDNTGIDGICNICEVGKKFHLNSCDVLARGKDLGLWKSK